MLAPDREPPLPECSASPHLAAGRVTRRAVALGALLTPLNAFWVVRLERVMFGPYPSTISLFANVVFLLFLLVGANNLLARVAPRWRFGQAELLTLYTMLAISTGLAGLDGAAIISQIMPHGAWFGESNHWSGWIGRLPAWLVVSDRELLRGHFLGATSFYQWPILKTWAWPMLVWTLFLTVLLGAAHCLNVLVRRQWADNERLTFPITWLPLELTEGGLGASLLSSRMMWTGFAIAALIGLWNGIAFLYPSVPSLAVGITDMKPYLTSKPWSALDWFPITFYPIAIGLGFLLPTDLLFSCWFFFLVWRAQVVIANAMAWDTSPHAPYIDEQGFGAMMGLFAFYLWSGRRSFRRIWQSARAGEGRGGEALSDREALAGLCFCCAVLVGAGIAAGATWWVAGVFFGVYLATLAVITRIRAELGPPVHDFHFMGPDTMLPRVVGASALRPADLTAFTLAFGLTRAHRGDTMPVGLEGLQMAHARGFDARRLFGAILLATALGALSTFWAYEHQAYALGAAAKFNQGFGHAQQAFGRTQSWLTGGLDPRVNPSAGTAVAVGAAAVLLLFACRVRLPGFPFHPIGFAISSSWAIHLVWMPLLIAWVLKSLVTRFGGLRGYRLLLPLFLGLVLGDCVVGSFWALVSVLLNVRTYNFFGA